MRKFPIFLILLLVILQCSQDEDKGLIPGQKITGNVLADALLFAALTNSPCHFITNENANQVLLLGEGSFSVCSTVQVNGSMRVQSSGTYEVTASVGKQTLSSSNCSSTRFDFHIAVKDDATETFSSKTSLSQNLVLEEGKTYSLVPSGLVDPSLYQCQGRAVSSSVSAYRLNFRKL